MLWPNGTTRQPYMVPNGETDYGPRKTGKGFHDGVDFANYFREVRSIAAGRVIRIERWDGLPPAKTRTQHGNRVYVDHGNGIESSYSHLSSVAVKVGDRVAEGQLLGVLGGTGFANGPHLHFEIRVNGHLVDPIPFVRARIGGSPASGDAAPFDPEEDDMSAAAEEAIFAIKAALLDGRPQAGMAKGAIDIILDNTTSVEQRMMLATGQDWDAFDELIRGVRSLLALAGRNPGGQVDVVALAAAVRDGLGDEVADELAERLTRPRQVQ